MNSEYKITPENAAFLAKHMEILSLRELAQSTISTYVSYMTQFIIWLETELMLLLDQVSWEQIRSYIKYLKDIKKLNARTINVHIAQLHDFYSYVLYRDWKKYEVPYLKFQTLLPKVPKKAEVQAMIEATKNLKHKAMIALLYSAGLRSSELCSLRCCDIYMKENRMAVNVGKNRYERNAILSEKVKPTLIQYVKECYAGVKREDWLFPGQKDGAHISTESMRQVFINALEAQGLQDMGYTPHSLRHAFALHLYDAGYDLLSIKEAMGHKSLNSTLVYVTLGIGNGRLVKSPYDL